MTNRKRTPTPKSWMLLCVLATWGCDEADDPNNQQQIQVDALVRDMAGDGGAGGMGAAGGEGGMGAAGGEGGVGGVGGAGGMGGEGGEGGTGGIRDLTNCDDICAVYDDCDRTGDLFPGGAAECATRCAEGSDSDRFADYRTCMQITQCADLQDCRIPTPPPPSCPDVCTAIDACAADYRLPTGLAGIETCAAACDDQNLSAVLSECGRPVLNGTCDEPAFANCVLTEVATDCSDECAVRAGCDPEVDPVDCTLACLAAEAPEDPVAARRVQVSQNCARNADSCDALAACDQRAGRPIVGDATIEDLCAANAECGFFAVDTCAEEAPGVLRRLADGAIDCFVDHLTNACGMPPLDCFVPGPQPAAACQEHCLLSDLCGLLPEDQMEFECLENCQAALVSGDPELGAPFISRFECIFAQTCEDLEVCQRAARPDIACRALCQTQIECGADGAVDCLAQCEAAPDTTRVRAERGCTGAADGCENVNLCVTAEAPTCGLFCDPVEACGQGVPGCLTECDNRDYAQPGEFLPLISCLNSTDRCADRQVCLDGDVSRGELCMAWCAASVTCNPQSDERLETCVASCAQDGITGQAGLTVEAASECLLEAGSDAECAVLSACLNGASMRDACPAYCGELDRCGLAEEGCEAECRNIQDNAFFSDAACVLNSRRRNANCETIAECIDVPLPPIPRPCDELCAAQATCDDSIDPFLCGLACDPDAEGLAVRAGCLSIAACEDVALCDAEQPAQPPECVAACNAIAACPGLVGEGADALLIDAQQCRDRCTGGAMLYGVEFGAGLQGCVGEAMCDAEAVTACFAAPSDLCARGAELVAICTDPAMVGYFEQCEALDQAAAETQIACLEEWAVRARASMGDLLVCFEGLTCFQ